jgi:lipoyl(octanoyl) transferase
MSPSRNTMGVIEFVRSLEEVLIRTCAEFGIPTRRISGLTGVWTGEDGRPSSSEAKIAALGVHISRGITSHGIALNVNTDLSYFSLIVPCGITSKPVTSLAKELGREIPMQDVAHMLARNFGKVFNSQILWLESLDALLGNNLGVPVRPPENLRKLHGEDDAAWA